MQSRRLGAAAVIAAGALWAQLVLIPMLASTGRGGLDVASLVVGLFALSLPVAAWLIGPRHERLAVPMILAGFPVTLGAFGIVAARGVSTHFDVAARVIAAATAVVFAGTAIAWARSLVTVFPVTLAGLEKRVDTLPAPPLRREIFGLLTAIAAFMAVIAPALVTSHPPANRAERIGGEALLRAREAVTSAGGLAIALALVLGAGSSLMRQRSGGRRRATRGLAFVLWGVAVIGLDWLIRAQR